MAYEPIPSYRELHEYLTEHWNDRRRDGTQRAWFDRAIAAIPADIVVDHLGAVKVAIRATMATQYRKSEPIAPPSAEGETKA